MVGKSGARSLVVEGIFFDLSDVLLPNGRTKSNGTGFVV